MDQTYTVHRVRYRGADGETRTFRTHRDAELAAADTDNMNDRAERMKYKTTYWAESEVITTDWVQPDSRLPRDKYYQTWNEHHKEGTPKDTWNVCDVKVHRKNGYLSDQVFQYERNYAGEPPFEPFRQGDREYALIASRYEGTDVVDLATGKIAATEDTKSDDYGFCPTGFYVPDWWDIHDHSEWPGQDFWDDRWDRWPDGSVGFVWGCHWGDDGGWKVQALDLSRVGEGVLARDERFGYQHLDTGVRGRDPRTFIRVQAGEGDRGPKVTFSVPKQFSIEGKLCDWYANPGNVRE